MWLFPTEITQKTGLNTAVEIRNIQRSALERVFSPSLLTTILNDSFRSADAYSVEQYLNDLFDVLWLPLTSDDEMQNKCRRELENAYLATVNTILNPPASGLAAIRQRDDVNLYVAQHLDRIEDYCRQQAATATGINRLHYDDLLRQSKLIRERMTTTK
jgi:hypothetical protein